MENREQVNWLKICWIRFCKSAPYTILYKTSMEDTEFKSLDLSPTCQERSPKFEKNHPGAFVSRCQAYYR